MNNTLEISVLVQLDNYAGNYDTFICALLTGNSDGRWGSETGLKLHEKYFGDKIQRKSHYSFEERSVEHDGNYHSSFYDISNEVKGHGGEFNGYDCVELFFQSDLTSDHFDDLMEHWKKVKGIELDSETAAEPVKILDFHFKTIYKKVEITKLS